MLKMSDHLFTYALAHELGQYEDCPQFSILEIYQSRSHRKSIDARQLIIFFYPGSVFVSEWNTSPSHHLRIRVNGAALVLNSLKADIECCLSITTLSFTNLQHLHSPEIYHSERRMKKAPSIPGGALVNAPSTYARITLWPA